MKYLIILTLLFACDKIADKPSTRPIQQAPVVLPSWSLERCRISQIIGNQKYKIRSVHGNNSDSLYPGYRGTIYIIPGGFDSITIQTTNNITFKVAPWSLAHEVPITTTDMKTTGLIFPVLDGRTKKYVLKQFDYKRGDYQIDCASAPILLTDRLPFPFPHDKYKITLEQVN